MDWRRLKPLSSQLPAIIRRGASYFSAHWHGQHPPLFTLLFSLLGLRILLGSIPEPDSNFLTLTLIIGSVLILIWQIIGTLRSSERHVKTTGDMMILWGAYAGIAIAAILTILQVLDLSADPPVITLESLRDKPLPTLSEDKTTIFLNGELDFSTNTDLLSLLQQNETIQTVELNSTGGLIYAARALAHSIGEHRLDTHVEAQCNSACTLAFMAGENRTLGITGKIGFHQYKFEKKHPLRIQQEKEEQEKDLNYFVERGIDAKFLKHLYQSDHQSIWQPDRLTLLSAGVITQ